MSISFVFTNKKLLLQGGKEPTDTFKIGIHFNKEKNIWISINTDSCVCHLLTINYKIVILLFHWADCFCYSSKCAMKSLYTRIAITTLWVRSRQILSARADWQIRNVTVSVSYIIPPLPTSTTSYRIGALITFGKDGSILGSWLFYTVILFSCDNRSLK